ncbi:AAA family ATPase [Bradyrhizobium sp. CCBAU 45384]|uniref:AAA family ATPase n=1 Tax=Bradyrhizobium sp. CCBAU 45384 TaxID=858428 RepID=UPI0023057705|nr:ATP-binding protein [Bradyrhizobium sp. CCBAU 45384]
MLFARLFDQRPELLRAIYEAAPVVLIDIADRQMLDQVTVVWKGILFSEDARLMDTSELKHVCTKIDAASMIVKETPKPSLKERYEYEAIDALCAECPVVAMSPLAESHLPAILRQAATVRIVFPRLDAATIARVIRLLTGESVRDTISEKIASQTTLADLVIAVRFDRTPAQCIAELQRLSDAKQNLKAARDLALSDLHGLGEARVWAEATISDIKAWKEGHISWSAALSSGVALNGPPGCGKTTFAAVFCREAGLHMVSASLAKWQGSGEGHLGHLLRAMRQDFEEARANIPACVFIDEIDSIADRARIDHAWRDYVVEVVNAVLAEIDGIKGREGVLVIGATNAISRCEPALLRSGRLEKIVNIGLPDSAELERMFRVRLRGDLQQEDLTAIVELATGMVGADVERVVKDARRTARNDGGRPLALRDLRGALVTSDDRPLELRWRNCVHEAGHLVADVIHFGPDNVFANTARVGSRGGRSVRTTAPACAGTLEVYRRRLQVILAGRAAEELLLGAGSHGAGGARESDLDHATSLAAAMVGSLGVIGADHITYFGARDDTRTLLSFAEVRVRVARELADAAAAARSLLEANRAVVEVVAQRLMDRGRVAGSEVSEVLRQVSIQASSACAASAQAQSTTSATSAGSALVHVRHGEHR